jgi:hypothetical protein
MAKGQPAAEKAERELPAKDAEVEVTEPDDDDESNYEKDSGHARKSSAPSHRLSSTSNLDNVNLDDESTPQQQGRPSLASIN